MALDEWQSEFSIIIKNDGSTSLIMVMEKLLIGKLLMEIKVLGFWNADYIFNGVMGIQRLRKQNKSYTSGMKNYLTNLRFSFLDNLLGFLSYTKL